MSLTHRILIIWMMAVTIHLPFPVCDGDDLKSGEAPHLETAEDLLIDIDVILLGCALPDDVDDGPVNTDPEDGSGSSFGPVFRSLTPRECEADRFFSLRWDCGDFDSDAGRLLGCLAARQPGLEAMPHQNLSLRTMDQNGQTVMRC